MGFGLSCKAGVVSVLGYRAGMSSGSVSGSPLDSDMAAGLDVDADADLGFTLNQSLLIARRDLLKFLAV